MTAHKLNDVDRRRVADYPMRELLDSKSFSLTNKIRIDRFIGCSDQQCDARLTTRLVWERGEFCLNAIYFAHGMSDNAIAPVRRQDSQEVLSPCLRYCHF